MVTIGMHITHQHLAYKLVLQVKIYGVRIRHILANLHAKVEVLNTILPVYALTYALQVWMMMDLFLTKEDATLNVLHPDIIGTLKTAVLVNRYAHFHQSNITQTIRLCAAF